MASADLFRQLTYGSVNIVLSTLDDTSRIRTVAGITHCVHFDVPTNTESFNSR